MYEAVIVSIARTAVGKAPRGTLRSTRPDDMAAAAIREAVRRVPAFDPAEVEDVILGCAMPEAEQGNNVARVASLRAGLPVTTPAMTVNRFCSSGLQAIALASERIQAGGAKVIVAGGTETMSMIPMGGYHFSPNPYLMEHYPDIYLSMGLTAENLAAKHQISREEQDQFALRSHQRAVAAIDSGKFAEEIIPVTIPQRKGDPVVVTTDERPRRDTSLDSLAKLRPAFRKEGGTVTAGNSSGLNDGAAALLVMSSERARELGLKPMARILSSGAAGVAPRVMGLGPVPAVRKALSRANLKLEQIGLVELNEAFAVQSLAVIEDLGLDPEIVNVNGGAIALGHPLGCSGARILTTLLYEMRRRAESATRPYYGLATLCVGVGQGEATIVEFLG